MATLSGYLVNTGTALNPVYKDLIDVFDPYTTGNKAPTTGFKISSGQDLCDVFAPILASCTPAPKTNMIALNGKDLNAVFAKKGCTPSPPPPPTPVTYTVTNGINYMKIATGSSTYVGLVFSIPYPTTYTLGQMIGNIMFNQDISANIIIVGGGGGGGLFQYGNGASYWIGCGGGGGAVITSKFNIKGSTTYNIAVGQGGKGGGVSTGRNEPNYTTSYQTSGYDSYFSDGSVYYTAGGGTLVTDTASGLQYSNGGSVTITPSGSPLPPSFYGGGGGGGGGEGQYATNIQGKGGSGGSYNGLNPGYAGTSAITVGTPGYWTYIGGSGGVSNCQVVSTPFSSTNYTAVGGGGAGGTYDPVPNAFFPGYAGDGTGGSYNDGVRSYGWSANANNNAYSLYTVSSGNTTTPGLTGLEGGYGAGGATDYANNYGDTAFSGFGGNGTVIIWWDNALYG